MDNTEPIASTDTNNKWFLRSDLHWTTFVEVPENDIREFNSGNGKNKKGLTDTDLYDSNIDYTNYKNGEDDCPFNGGFKNGDPSNGIRDPKYYFYKGFGESDCIKFVADILNIK